MMGLVMIIGAFVIGGFNVHLGVGAPSNIKPKIAGKIIAGLFLSQGIVLIVLGTLSVITIVI